MTAKRCFNTTEAMAYLGVRRRFFDTHLAPELKDKAVKAGTSVVYERADLDNAWDRYKLMAGSERANEDKISWDVQRKVVSTRRKTGRMRLTQPTAGSAFADAVLSLTKKPGTTSLPKSNG